MQGKKSGFTLIEMIIVLSLTVLIIGIASSIFITGNKVFADSDVKTTLQMDAKDIQERISNICMQADCIKSVSLNNDDEITELQINSYDNEGQKKVFNVKNTENGLDIDGYKIQSHVTSVKINKDIVEESKKEKPDYTKFNSIQFNIIIEENKGFANDIKYPLNFTVAFRNKGK